ncbi:MAG: hypothetical protein ACRDCE_20260 [Cetobacterium sp.]|uniref:hypothetical protein n=1 Tax=Cetobacterium sp. TaxID=2071632 RepID=UPI003EE7AAA7
MFASKIARFVITALIKSLAKEAACCDTKRGKLAKKNHAESIKLEKRIKELEAKKIKAQSDFISSSNQNDTERRALEAKAWNNRAMLEKLKSIGM